MSSSAEKSTFQLTRPVWGEPPNHRGVQHPLKISTHSPRVGRTDRFSVHRSGMPDFNSLAPCGANPGDDAARAALFDFNSLAPCGANLTRSTTRACSPRFQLTRPVWGEPVANVLYLRHCVDFNSLAPCGANPSTSPNSRQCPLFQLTRPVWGEPPFPRSAKELANISTHSPRVGRTCGRTKASNAKSISTHSPRVGRTLTIQGILSFTPHFNSLAPCGANQYGA